jgi:hypothetical protein
MHAVFSLLAVLIMAFSVPVTALGQEGTYTTQQIITTGFGNSNNTSVTRMCAFSGSLYAGTENDSQGSQIWRSTDDGLNWAIVEATRNGFGDPNNTEIMAMTEWNGALYVSTRNEATGTELWATTNGTSWSQVNANGFGSRYNEKAREIIPYQERLFVLTGNYNGGGQVWASSNGTSWTQINTSGFGNYRNTDVAAGCVFDGYLFCATEKEDSPTGIEIWRYNGSSWTKTASSGFGDTNNVFPTCMTAFNGYIYVGTENNNTIGETWRSADGSTWERVGQITGTTYPPLFAPAVVENDRIYAWGSRSRSENLDAAYYSSNGVTWSPVVLAEDGSHFSGFPFYSVDDKIYAAVPDSVDYNDVWQLTRTDTGQPDENLSVSAPTNFEAPQGTTVSVPINWTNTGGIGIEGIDIILSYDPSVISATGATLTGGILETQNYTIQANTGVSGQVSLAISANAGLFNGQGIIAYVNFEAVGDVDDVSGITFTRAQINEADVSIQNGSIRVIASTYDISGTVRFFATSNPVPNASLDLTGTGSRQANTNASGQFTITGVEPGNYTLTPSKSDDLGGLSATDASRIARHAVGLQSFSCMEKIAADVSRNGEISSVDASRVARYAVGLITCLNDTTDCRDWVFVPQTISACTAWPPITFDGTRTYTPLSADLTGQDFVAVRLGDVTGNWTPAATVVVPAVPRAPMAMPLEAGCEKIVATDDALTVPIVLEQEVAIEGLDIRLSFDESVLDATDATLGGGVLDGQNYTIQTNLGIAGEVSLAISANSNLFTGSGNVAFVTFTVVGDAGATDLSFARFDVNETPAAGRFRIVENLCPTVHISLGTVPTTGTLTGKVTTGLFGQSVDVIGATVRVVGTQISSTTDDGGNYALTEVPAGTQELEIVMDRFEALTVTGVEVVAGSITPVAAASTVLSLAPECSAAQLEAVRAEEQQKWDANGDGKIGIEEAIRALQMLAGME